MTNEHVLALVEAQLAAKIIVAKMGSESATARPDNLRSLPESGLPGEQMVLCGALAFES